MNRLTLMIVALVLVALGVSEADAQCRRFGRFRERRQARIESRRGFAYPHGNYAPASSYGGCAGPNCPLPTAAVMPAAPVRPAAATPLYAVR